MEGVSPFASFGICIAAGMQWRGWMAGGDESCLEGCGELGGMLKVFGKRWKGVGESFCFLLSLHFRL